jgi:hypothetical protein
MIAGKSAAEESSGDPGRGLDAGTIVVSCCCGDAGRLTGRSLLID